MSSSAVFDQSYYLTNNADVVVAISQGFFANALDHYTKFGGKELRQPNATFNPNYYAINNADVLNAVASGTFVNVFAHFQEFGESENRAPSTDYATFDSAAYLTANTDVAAAVTAGTFTSALDHFLAFGQNEGRTGSGVAETVANTGSTFTLTTGIDTLTGTANNDTFVAFQDTVANGGSFGVTDTIAGGAGTDTLKLVNSQGAASNGASVTGIENLEYRATAAGATLDMDDFVGVTSLTLDRIVGATDISNVVTTTALTLKAAPATQDSTFTYKSVTGASDVATVTFDGVTDGAEFDFSGAVETMNISTANNASRFDKLVFDAGTTTLTIAADEALQVDDNFTAAAVTSITVTGDSLVTLTPTLATTVVTLDSSAQTAGGLRVTTGNVADTNGTVADLTVTGGAGSDRVNVAATDAGDDLSVSLGAGDDRITIAGLVMDASDSIAGGDGTDTIVMSDEAALATAPIARITGFEVLSLTDDNDGALDTFDASLITGLTGVTIATDSAADGYSITNLSATAATDVTVSGTQAVDLTIGVANAATVGQIDTLTLKINDGITADNTITLADLSAANVENVNLDLSAGDNLTATVLTGLTGLTTMTVTGSGDLNVTSGALALNGNASVDASAITGTGTFDFTNATTNGLAIKGSSTKNNTITGSAQADAITGGTATDSVVTTAGATIDSFDMVDDGVSDNVDYAAVAGRLNVTNFDAGTDGTSEDLINVSANTVDGAEIVITTAAAAGAITNDRTIVIEQTVGAAAALTTSGTATLTTANFTAGTLTAVAAYLDERFTHTNNTTAADTAAFIVMNNGTNSYAYAFSESAIGNTSVDAAELTLVGVYTDAIVRDEDIFQTI
jgi:hypothetical protein